MKLIKFLVVLGCVSSLLAGSALAADKAQPKQTCCEKAAAEKQECRHKCCVAAHKDGKSCEKCNPNKEDLKFLKKSKKADKAVAK
jgi:hypothetical protein